MRWYVQHLFFWLRVGIRLSLSSTAILIYSVFPFVKVPYDLDLDSVALYLFEKNNELED